MWNSLHPNQVIGAPALVKEFDCLTATLDETASVRSQFRIPIDSGNAKIAGFAGWFDVHFRVRFCILLTFFFSVHHILKLAMHSDWFCRMFSTVRCFSSYFICYLYVWNKA